MEQTSYVPTVFNDIHSDFLTKGDVITFDAFGDGIQRKFKVMKIDGYIATLLSIEDATYTKIYQSSPEHKGIVAMSYYQGQEGSSTSAVVRTDFYNDFNCTAIYEGPFSRAVYDTDESTHWPGGYDADYYSNVVVYNKLSQQVRDAIIDTDVDQYLYLINVNVSKDTEIPSHWQSFVKIPQVSHSEGTEPVVDYYQTLNAVGKRNIGLRHIYVPCITDLLEYYGISPEDTNNGVHELTYDQLDAICPSDNALGYYSAHNQFWLRAVAVNAQNFWLDSYSYDALTLVVKQYEEYPESLVYEPMFWHGPVWWQENYRFMFKIDLALIPITKITE